MTFFEYLCVEAGMTLAEAKAAQARRDRELADMVKKLRPEVYARREAWKRAIQSDT